MFTILKDGIAPKIKTEFSSSADLCSRGDIIIGVGETKIIPLGVKIDLEQIKNICFGEYKAFMKIQDPKNGFTTTQFQEAYTNFLKSHFFELKIRSSGSTKKGLIIANGSGEIDLDYPDEIGLIVHNPVKQGLPVRVIQKLKPNSSELEGEYLEYLGGEITIKAGEPIAQIKLMPHKNYLMPDEYRSTAKRVGGFGSTGSNS
ncbi:MAG: hypothetical protein EOM78_00690 [Erysipelotrichia bacterium]|nr:hypothetical protein [Erysipelotrichia bacterium]